MNSIREGTDPPKGQHQTHRDFKPLMDATPRKTARFCAIEA
jgi:hypothetical protein